MALNNRCERVSEMLQFILYSTISYSFDSFNFQKNIVLCTFGSRQISFHTSYFGSKTHTDATTSCHDNGQRLLEITSNKTADVLLESFNYLRRKIWLLMITEKLITDIIEHCYHRAPLL